MTISMLVKQIVESCESLSSKFEYLYNLYIKNKLQNVQALSIYYHRLVHCYSYRRGLLVISARSYDNSDFVKEGTNGETCDDFIYGCCKIYDTCQIVQQYSLFNLT